MTSNNNGGGPGGGPEAKVMLQAIAEEEEQVATASLELEEASRNATMATDARRVKGSYNQRAIVRYSEAIECAAQVERATTFENISAYGNDNEPDSDTRKHVRFLRTWSTAFKNSITAQR